MPDNVKPSQGEEEYFAREEAERKRALALKVKQEMAEADRKRLRDLHFMHCPKCGQAMQEVKLLGVDVDVCFACKGIFLDSGELEELRRIGQTKQGIVTAILNWFRPESGAPRAR
jgi:hypothetical protein